MFESIIKLIFKINTLLGRNKINSIDLEYIAKIRFESLCSMAEKFPWLGTLHARMFFAEMVNSLIIFAVELITNGRSSQALAEYKNNLRKNIINGELFGQDVIYVDVNDISILSLLMHPDESFVSAINYLAEVRFRKFINLDQNYNDLPEAEKNNEIEKAKALFLFQVMYEYENIFNPIKKLGIN